MGQRTVSGRTLWELIDRRAEATPDALMAVDEDMRTLSFLEFATEAERAAAGLANYGIDRHTPVSWQMPTWLESLVLVAALSRLGATQNPLLPIYRRRDLDLIVGEVGSKLLVVPSTWKGTDYEALATGVAQRAGGLQVLVADKALPQGDPTTLDPPDDGLGPDHADGLPGDPGTAVRWLFYTSGTAAEPKGARHSDATLSAAARGMGDRLALIPDDRCALVFPFTHIGGIVWLFAALQFGCSLILVESFDPEATPEVLGREGVTVAGAGTPFHLAYRDYQKARLEPVFPNVRVFPGGGAPKSPQLFEDLRKLFDAPILSGYGLTEAPIVTMASVDDSDDELVGSEGKAQPGVELRIVGPDGAEAAPGADGEVRIKAPQLMAGYVDPTLDAEAFDELGFFRTGDLGHLDERANLVISGRLKDVIIRKGENVSAKELEDHLAAHPSVDDVAVVGVPDDERGEMVVAVVEPNADLAPLTLDEMVTFLDEAGVVRQRIPERLELVERIPRNPAGKVLKDELRDRFS